MAEPYHEQGREPRVVVVGSLNLDEVFHVPHVVHEGETLGATTHTFCTGGKGANQSVALAKAGALTYHCGRVGKDGVQLVQTLEKANVRTDGIVVSDTEPTGRAIIQLSEATRDNAIVLFPGANHCLSFSDVKTTILEYAGKPGDWLVLQNECRIFAESMSKEQPPADFHAVIELAADLGMHIAFSPAPYTMDVCSLYPFEKIDVLMLNVHEAASLVDTDVEHNAGIYLGDAKHRLHGLAAKFPSIRLIVLTLGTDGSIARLLTADQSGDRQRPHTEEVIETPAAALSAPLVDTTGAGDTFAAYFIAGLMRANQRPISGDRSKWSRSRIEAALYEASVASALACEGYGAMAAIPTWTRVQERMAIA